MSLSPTALRAAFWSLGVDGPLALDTETSGLFADDGARVSTVSLAWEDPGGSWFDIAREPGSGLVWKREVVGLGDPVNVVSIAWPFDQGVAGTGKPEDNGQETLFPEPNLDEQEWRELCALVSSHLPGLIMHNAPFDCEKMRVGVRCYPNSPGPELMSRVVWDSQNVNDLLWPTYRTSLKPTCSRLFGVEFADESDKVKAYLRKHRLPKGRWDLMPWDVVGPYAAMDARLTLMLKIRQEREIVKRGGAESAPNQRVAVGGLRGSERRRLVTTGALYSMTKAGLPYHAARSIQAAEQVGAMAREAAAGLPFAPKDAKEWYFTSKGLNLPPYAVTDKGAPSLTAEVLGRMVEDEVPHAARYLRVVKLETARSMWYQGYADKIGPDDRLRTYFKQTGTRSTRFSVERVNLQAVPQDYRLSEDIKSAGILTPRQLVALAVEEFLPGWGLWEFDLQQAELRIASLHANCTPMLRMIRENEDLHAVTTRALFPKVEQGTPEWKIYRQVGKRANFSLMFNAQGETFGKMISKETGLRFPLTESTRVVRQWNGLYPEFAQANQRHRRAVETRMRKNNGYGSLTLANGEKRYWVPGEDATKAFNQRVQGDQAQFGIDWLNWSYNFQRELGLPVAPDGGLAGLLLVIHDSQLWLLPDDRAEEVTKQVADAGVRLWNDWFPGVPGGIDIHRW